VKSIKRSHGCVGYFPQFTYNGYPRQDLMEPSKANWPLMAGTTYNEVL